MEENEMELCNEGDVMYKVCKTGVDKIIITKIEHHPHCVYRDNRGNHYFNRNINTSCFKTLEEAEKEFTKRELITKKRKMLKEYEEKLNNELGIENHFIIK